MKKIITLSLALLATLGANAQSKLSSTITNMLSSVEQQIADAQSAPKGMSLTSKASPACPVDTAAIKNQLIASFNPDGSVRTVDVIAQLADGATCPTATLKAKGITVNDEALGFVFLTVPADMLEFLETLEEFIHLDADNINQPNNDNSRAVLNVSKINGIDIKSVLSSSYTGKGVVVGIIDAGIDYNHIAFKDSNGNTRIKKAVNYASGSGGYTIATTPEQIAALTWDNSSTSDPSHGTHVACSAAGSQVNALVDYSLGSRNLMGMAPEADLVLCGTNNYSDARILKCLDEIISTAEGLGEPCVINMSFGTTGGWHHSTTLSQAIDKVAKAGVVVCMSTANDARNNWCVDKTISKDEYLTIIPTKTGTVAGTERSYIPSQTISFYLPKCTNKSAFSYSLAVVDSLTGTETTLAQTPLKKKATSTQYTPSISFSAESGTGWLSGTLSLSESYFDENSKFLVVKITNVSDTDIRIYAMSNRQINKVYQNNFASTKFPNYTYDEGTADISINNSCCTENIISVGSYTRSRFFLPYNDDDGTPNLAFSEGDVGKNNSTSKFSSYGRDDYGKAHPDVIAPGVAIASAYNYYDTKRGTASDKSTWTPLIAAYYTESNNKMNLWKVENGTSMATPITAGIIALWMQAYRENAAPGEPDLSVADIREIIQNTSRTEVNGENIAISRGDTEQALQLGYGLIDAEAGLKYILHILSLKPVKEETTTTFVSDDFDKDIDIVNNVYHSISNGYYDTAESCVVLNQPTTSFDESALNDITDVNSETDIEGFNGFIQAVSGKGSIKINAQTFGSTNLAVKIGNDNANIYKLTEKGNITLNYVKDAYIFIYPTSSNASNSMDLATTDNTTDNAVKIHSITVSPEVTAIAHVNSANNSRNNNIVKKFVSNKIIIVKNGKLYSTAGQQVK